MKNKIKNTLIMLGLSSLVFVACKDQMDPLVEELKLDRILTPIELEAQIRNMTNVELDWELRDDATSYVVEISKDSLLFTNIIESLTVTPDEIPVTIPLEGEEGYSARVKAVSDAGLGESNWAAIVFKTGAENIFNPIEGDKIKKTEVTVSWEAGADVSHFLITTAGQDAVRRDITEAEAAAGEAVITGLNFGTTYGITMYNEPSVKQRGFVEVTTLPEGETLTSDMDLNEAINTTFAEQDVFLLSPGDYAAYAGTLNLNRSVKIKGLNSADKPKVHLQVVLQEGATNVELSDLEMAGIYTNAETSTEEMLDVVVQIDASAVDYESLAIQGCDIHGYGKSFISDGGDAFAIQSIVVDNCIVSDVYNSGGDFIDSRASYFANLTVTNSTFNNVATVNTRDFIRMDGGSKGNDYDDGSRTPEVEVSNCTFYNVMNSTSSTKRFFYVRWSQHSLVSENNLFVDMGVSVYSNQSLTIQPECSMNNYFNADGYYTVDGSVLIDNSANYTTLDPGFTDAANGDFTVTNQALKDDQIGDPRWLFVQ